MEILNLFEITVEVSFLILFIGIVRILLKKFLNPNLRYFLWIFVAIRILVPLHVNISVAVPQIPQDNTLYLGMDVNLENTFLSLPQETSVTSSAEENGEIGSGAIPKPSITQGTGTMPDTGRIPSAKEILMLIWLSGVIIIAVCLLINNIKMFRKLKAGRREIKKLPGGLSLYAMPGHNCLAGVLFPAVYVDVEQIDDNGVIDHIIRHELQHYRVRDHYWQLLRVICLILQWHNPFVWWAYFASKRDCEMACDARVIRDMSSAERYGYGDSLLTVIELSSLKGQAISFTTSMSGGRKFMQERIKNIMQHKRRYAIVLSVIVICVIGVLGFITFRLHGEESEKGHFTNDYMNVPMGPLPKGKEVLSAEEIAGLETAYNIDISMEAIINGTDGYEEVHDRLWNSIDNSHEEGGFMYGERGFYISLTPILFWSATANEIFNDVWFAVFTEDLSEMRGLRFSPEEDSLTMMWDPPFSDSMLRQFTSAPDEKYICILNPGAFMLGSDNSLYPAHNQTKVEGDYYHALDYEKLGISYNDFTAKDQLFWIGFTDLPSISRIPLEDTAVIPEVPEYSYQDAVLLGTVEELHGMLPGTGEGMWYTVRIDGIEYYYGRYDHEETKEPELYGFSIVSEDYSLANGLKVGMNEREVLEQFPNMAVMNFDGPGGGDYVYSYVTGHQGWNGIAYPRSYVGMDSDWKYYGEDYYWTNQFDYIMIADIILEDYDRLPLYLGLLIKYEKVAAITFYYPTAG